MNKTIIFFLFLRISAAFGQIPNPQLPDFSQAKPFAGVKFVWQDEFNENGKPNSKFWKSEKGFVRNEELQWYKEENANCQNGVLLIEGKRVNIANPNFEAGNSNWRKIEKKSILHRPVFKPKACKNGNLVHFSSEPKLILHLVHGLLLRS